MDEYGIPWPISISIAGASLGAMFSMFVWLIRRQASGKWMLTEQHVEDMKRQSDRHEAEVARILDEKARAIAGVEAEKARAIKAAEDERDRAVERERMVAVEWHGAHDTLLKAHGATTTALEQSTDGNKYLDIILRRAAGVPPQGDNVPREGVVST